MALLAAPRWPEQLCEDTERAHAVQNGAVGVSGWLSKQQPRWRPSPQPPHVPLCRAQLTAGAHTTCPCGERLPIRDRGCPARRWISVGPLYRSYDHTPTARPSSPRLLGAVRSSASWITLVALDAAELGGRSAVPSPASPLLYPGWRGRGRS